MDKTYEIFYPGRYSPAEQAALDRLKQQVELSGGVGPMSNRTEAVCLRDMRAYAALWDPYNPLFNDPAYAAGTRWGRLPALPCFPFMENISGFPMMDDVGDDLGNVFYYANDGGEIELFRPVFEGDVLTFRSGRQTVTDITPLEGSPLRMFTLYGEGEMLDAGGAAVGRGVGHGRNAMRRILDGPVPSQYEQTYEWVDTVPPVHVTTPAEWGKIVALWKDEELRGALPRNWNAVSVGDRLTPVCSGPISDLEMIRLHSDMVVHAPSVRDQLLAGEDLMTDAYGQKLPFLARHYSYCRNPKVRAVFYNFTARNFILRMLTNWMGDDAFLRSFRWRFQNLFSCMSENRPGEDILARIPAMRGKFVNRHGMEGDTAICFGEVTDKYEDHGKNLVEVSCWAETLDGDIIQVVDAKIELPRS